MRISYRDIPSCPGGQDSRCLGICQGYVRDISDICFLSHSGICQGYTRHISLLVNRPAVAMQLAGCFGIGTGIESVIMGV